MCVPFANAVCWNRHFSGRKEIPLTARNSPCTGFREVKNSYTDVVMCKTIILNECLKLWKQCSPQCWISPADTHSAFGASPPRTHCDWKKKGTKNELDDSKCVVFLWRYREIYFVVVRTSWQYHNFQLSPPSVAYIYIHYIHYVYIRLNGRILAFFSGEQFLPLRSCLFRGSTTKDSVCR